MVGVDVGGTFGGNRRIVEDFLAGVCMNVAKPPAPVVARLEQGVLRAWKSTNASGVNQAPSSKTVAPCGGSSAIC